MKQVAAAGARVLLALIGMLILSVLSLFVVAVYLTTYPILRLNQNDARLRAGLDAAAAVAALVAVLRTGAEAEPVPEGDEVTPAPMTEDVPPL
jgi:uncharacterized membrane protein